MLPFFQLKPTAPASGFQRSRRLLARCSLGEGSLRLASGSLGIALIVLLAGCQTSIPRRSGGPIVGTQGAASEVLFSPSEAADVDPSLESRRDNALALREESVETLDGVGGLAGRSDLRTSRRVRINTDTTSYLYFESSRRNDRQINSGRW